MGTRLPLIQTYLQAQQELRAVEQFSRHHDNASGAGPSIYSAQIPLSAPGKGEQYAFQVDLDACTGCKACVVGCNTQNGLDPDEAWRSVGLIHGGDADSPIQQTVTTACHHCLDPACMTGCPVGAYEKSPTTGIVKHLDDQCIGCQYCTLMCPYEVPQFNKRLGIVRKCDMCEGRLAQDEAPACVDSCPNDAISIKIVEISEVLDDAQGDAFLPGAPSPAITGPTTTYQSKRNLPRNALPANFYNMRPAARHLPLVLLLVLTQLSVGTFTVDALTRGLGQETSISDLGKWRSIFALGLGLLALLASTTHIGRPLYMFRAFIGLKTSWMSREIIAFGVFIQVALLYTLSFWAPALFSFFNLPATLGLSLVQLRDILAGVTTLFGLVALLCSVRLYVVTRRKFWNGTATSLRFFGTSALLGVGAVAATTAFTARTLQDNTLTPDFENFLLWFSLMSLLKMSYESSIFRHLFDKQQGDLKRSALLMTRALRDLTIWRFILGSIGGIFLPLTLFFTHAEANSTSTTLAVFAALLFTIGGELLERVLFFTALSAPRMPGAIGK